MSQYDNLKATIALNVYENHNNQVTANMVKAAMNAMTDSLGAGYQYLGIATPNTAPGTPDQKVFYIAAQPGDYTNFGTGITVNDGEVAILKYDTAWHKEVTGAATAAQVTELGQKSIWINPTVSYFTDVFSYDVRNLIAAAWFTEPTWGDTRDIAISALGEVGGNIKIYFDILTEKGNVSSAYHAFVIDYLGKGVVHSAINDRLKIIFNIDSISDIHFAYGQALIVLSDFIYKNNYQIFDNSIGAEKIKDGIIDNTKITNKTLTREKSNYYINPFDGVNLSYAAPSEIINTVENEGYTTTPTNGTFYTPGPRECRGEIVESDNPCNLKYVRKYTTNGGSINYRLMSLVFNYSAGINKFTIGFLLDITDFALTDYNDGATLSSCILFFSDDSGIRLGDLLFGETNDTKVISNVGTISFKTYIERINHYQDNRVWAFVNIRGEFSYNEGVSPLTYVRLSINVNEYENGKLYYVANLTADFTNDKQLNPILYYGKNIVELNKKTEENSQDIEMLKEVVGTDKKNLLHLNLTDDQLSYIISPFKSNNDFKVYFKAKRTSTYIQNPCLNFDSAVLVDKTTEQETVVHSMLDDITPAYYNNSYMGGNHGNSDCVTVTVNNHDKTYADIGSVWEDASHNECVLVAIESSNSLSFYGPNTKNYPFFKFNTSMFANGTVLTHKSGATHTDSITLGSDGAQKQFKASLAVKALKFIADGKELTEPGDYYFSHLDICEEYDVFNVASVIEKIKEGVGTFTANPLPNSFDDADKVVRHSIIYGFDAANDWKMAIDFILYQNIILSYYGFTQQTPVDGNSIYMYIPKTLPISNGEETIDFRTIVPYNRVPSSMNITSTYWENPQLPPDRWMQYNDNIALHSGYLFDYGVGGNNRKDNINNAFYLYTSRKCYPHGISGVPTHAGDVYSAVVWRKYIDRSEVNTNGVIARNVFEYNNKCYIYADFNSEGIYEIDIPAKYIGKNIEVFENSDNVSLLSSIANAKVLVKVTNTSPMYGYLVAQIK